VPSIQQKYILLVCCIIIIHYLTVTYNKKDRPEQRNSAFFVEIFKRGILMSEKGVKYYGGQKPQQEGDKKTKAAQKTEVNIISSSLVQNRVNEGRIPTFSEYPSFIFWRPSPQNRSSDPPCDGPNLYCTTFLIFPQTSYKLSQGGNSVRLKR